MTADGCSYPGARAATSGQPGLTPWLRAGLTLETGHADCVRLSHPFAAVIVAPGTAAFNHSGQFLAIWGTAWSDPKQPIQRSLKADA
jgi:hypothetical protein